MGDAHHPSRAPSVRGPARLAVRARSRRPSLRWNFVPLTLSERRLRREAALEAELRPEAHVDQRAHLRGGEIHERSITHQRGLSGPGLERRQNGFSSSSICNTIFPQRVLRNLNFPVSAMALSCRTADLCPRLTLEQSGSGRFVS